MSEIEKLYTNFQKAKTLSNYGLDNTDHVLTKQEDGRLGYLSAGIFATTGSNVFFGNQTINGDLNVNGDIRVSTLISASTIYESGSTIFGNSGDDFHQFTGSIYLSGSLKDVNSITFNSSSIPTTLPNYTLAANLTDKTLDLRMGNNATLQLGQEMYYPPIVNKSGEDLLDGDLVMINPAGVAQGNRISVVKCVSDGTYPADFIVGVLTEDVARNAEGFATWFGYVRNISKTHLQPAGETWVEGDILYPNPTIPGKMTNVLPTAPALKSTIAAVTSINGNNVTLLVRPALRGKLDTLHNVDTTSATTGSILYNSGSVWKSTNNFKIQNGYVILSQVSASLNFANDTTAAAAGVPLGGLYHTSGSIKIRLV